MIVACMCAFASLKILAGNVSQKTVPIGVRVDIGKDVDKLWGDPAKTSIPADALAEFLTRIKTHLAHWDFDDQTKVGSVVTVTLAATKTHRDEVFLQILLDVPPHKDKVLAEKHWIDDLKMAYPPEKTAKDAIHCFIDDVFPPHGGTQRRIPFDLDKLSELAPLATDPKWVDPIDKTFVLPLSKERFSHLRWSVFRLHSDQGHPSKRDLTAEPSENEDDHWEQYSSALTEALKVKGKDATNKDPSNYRPVRVYLEEYVPDYDVGWGVE